ncbi:putative (S)-N-methylcoclaurine 3'-hydroxylase isozyme 2 [Sesamum angolense]|uniref:(S)-N-methylcoclaurine 3'-hydroxylase isozyme 2 n=1 Tax=Sesamum angolense TaxID=2727404 RepID=A0AAE1X1G8_9LAMI|nr:putative (S)-N-methylcoclaurine 3'-hydroxylase isozyme 2 [Sesamum angolense]
MDSRNAVINHENVSNFTFLSLMFVLLFMIMRCIARGASPAIPPGPFPWPVIGNFLQVGENPHIKLSRMAGNYGPIMSLRVGARLVVVGSSVKAAVEILKTHDRVLSGRHLSYTQPASCPKINQYWIGFARVDVIGFGPDGSGAGPELKELTRQYLNLIAATNVADLFPILHGLDIQGMQKKVRKITEKMFVMWQDIVRERRDQRSKGVRAQEDFLDSLLEIGLSDNHIKLLVIGIVTCWDRHNNFNHHLGISRSNKKKRRVKLRDELTGRIGDKTIQESELMDLPYLQACIKESIRLHPPVPFLFPRL